MMGMEGNRGDPAAAREDVRLRGPMKLPPPPPPPPDPTKLPPPPPAPRLLEAEYVAARGEGGAMGLYAIGDEDRRLPPPLRPPPLAAAAEVALMGGGEPALNFRCDADGVVPPSSCVVDFDSPKLDLADAGGVRSAAPGPAGAVGSPEEEKTALLEDTAVVDPDSVSKCSPSPSPSSSSAAAGESSTACA